MKTHSKRIDFQKRTAEGQNGEEERECELNDDDKGVGNAEEDERIEEVEDAPEDEEDGEIDFSKQRPNCTKSPLLATQIWTMMQVNDDDDWKRQSEEEEDGAAARGGEAVVDVAWVCSGEICVKK